MRPCPQCGSPLPDQGRFCGQCGATVPSSEPPNVHEEVTIAREIPMPDMKAIGSSLGKTMLDSAPYGATAAAKDPAATKLGRPLTLEERLERSGELPSTAPPAPAAGAPAGSGEAPAMAAPATAAPAPAPAAGGSRSAKTIALGQTLNDPDAEARAREMRDAILDALGNAPTDPSAAAARPAPAGRLNKTMLLGGDAPVAPPASAALAPSQRPTALPEEPIRQADASPLSRSVTAPTGSWHPPAPAGNVPATAPGLEPFAPGPGERGAAPTSLEPAPVVSVGAPAPNPDAPPPVQPPPAQPQAAPPLRTMLGMPARDLPPGPGPSNPLASTALLHQSPGAPGPAQAAQAAQAAGAGGFPPAQKTIMGVAIPGVAPSQPSAPIDPRDIQSRQGTMLGVAVPGIAPTHARPQTQPLQAHPPNIPSQVQNTALGIAAPPNLMAVVPAPAPLHQEALPDAPQKQAKSGIPAVAVVVILIVLVAVLGGVGAFFALRQGATLAAVPQLDETGRESLKITCASCPDGTTVSLGASSAPVTGSAALLPLPAPLSIGDNDLVVKIDRPGAGRDEDVKVHVPVAYRVRADLTTLAAKPPAITVRVEATPGSEVTVDEKPVTLDGTGRGSYAIDLAKETEGTGDAKPYEKKIPFAITPKGGKPETGQLTARTAIVPLALDAPGLYLVTDKTTAAVKGQTRAGTTMMVDGASAPVDAQGNFGVRVELTAPGERTLEIVAAAPPLAPRIVKAKVVRVATLAEGAKTLDAEGPIAYDAFGADAAAKAGKMAVVEGDVVEVRVTAGHTVLLVEDKKTCAKGASCIVRAEHGEEDTVARGAHVKVYGRIAGVVTSNGKSVPDLDAALVIPTKAGK